MEELKEICNFLDIQSRMDVKAMALEYILGLSGNSDGVSLLAESKETLEKVILLLDDTAVIKRDALLCMVNISAESVGIAGLMYFEGKTLKFSKSGEKTIIARLAHILLDSEDKDADAACMLICNLSRSETFLDDCVTGLMPYLNKIMDAFTNLDYNKAESKLHYLGPLWSNLSGKKQVRDWLCDNNLSNGGAMKVASFCRFGESIVRRGGAVGTIRNLFFDVELHNWLLSSEVDILTYLLLPLAGGEEFDDDEMSKLPPSLQYLSSDKQREPDPDIRKMLLESLNKICVKKTGREFLRDNGTYYILRELHKWEKDRTVLLACENVVDILIKKEDEIMVDDISMVTIPEEYSEKFAKMDNDFLADP